jgi:hypothetical protein
MSKRGIEIPQYIGIEGVLRNREIPELDFESDLQLFPYWNPAPIPNPDWAKAAVESISPRNKTKATFFITTSVPYAAESYYNSAIQLSTFKMNARLTV